MEIWRTDAGKAIAATQSAGFSGASDRIQPDRHSESVAVCGLPAVFLHGGRVSGPIKRACPEIGRFAAGTIVVINPEHNEPDLNQLLQGKYNSFIDYPHLVARLRQRTSVQMTRAALMALLRREALDPQARVDLFKRIADAFRERVSFTAEITEGMSDERYVRNCVDLLYQHMKPPTREMSGQTLLTCHALISESWPG